MVTLRALGLGLQHVIDLLEESSQDCDDASTLMGTATSLAHFLEEGNDGVQNDLGRAVELCFKEIDAAHGTAEDYLMSQ